MGGTSTDVALCQNGEPTIGRETSISHFRIKIPSVNVHTVGAGGGSIAHVPQLTGALRVGPQSAGAEPGPAAYGQGGEEPTVTDANVVVGHLPPSLLGGEMTLDVDAARAAVQKIADAMGLSLEQAADGILSIVNENMAGALRLVSVQRGHDPRDFALVAFGGAGPLHANAVAKLMGSYPGDRPALAGAAVRDRRPRRRTSATSSRARSSGSRARRRPTRCADILEELGGARARVDGLGGHRGRRPARSSYVADMRYHGQGYEIPVALDAAKVRATDSATSRSASTRCTSSSTASACTTRRARSSTCARSATARCRSPSCRPAPPGGADPSAAVVEEHAILFEGEHVPTRIYDRTKLSPGARIPGPAVVTEFDSTTVVLPGFTAEVDIHFNLLINPGA